MQIELHRHLELSIRLSTLLQFAQLKGLEGQSTTLESFQEKIPLMQPQQDLRSVLAKLELYQKVMDRPESLERIAFEAVEDCWNEGTRTVEFRYAPNFISEKSGLCWNEVLASITQGLNRGLSQFPEMKAGLICIAVRDFGKEEVDKTIEFFLKNSHTFIGVDLAGNEDNHPCRLFETSFRKAIAKNAKVTIHAGEAAGPESIWEAIELLGASRIGHGVTAIQDPQLIDRLIQEQICLEVCPTSNWITQAIRNLEEHPLPQFLKMGVPVCISTDDPRLFGVTMKTEIGVCQQVLGMTSSEIEKCHDYAYQASLLIF
jgi:adenosine deaminase